MKQDTPIESPTVQALDALFEYFHQPDQGVARTCRTIARELNKQFRPHRNWHWQYVHQVLHQKLKPSVRLAQAIFRLYKKVFLSAEPALQTVSIRAPVGFVPAKALVLTRARICALETCQQSFIPANPNQRFHSPSCRKYNHRQKGGSKC